MRSIKSRRVAGCGRQSRVFRSTAARPPGGGRTLNLATPSLAPSNRRPLAGRPCPARFRRRSRPLPGDPAAGGREGIRASSPAGATGMSEQAGADLPVARDGEGQLSMDALRSPAAGTAPELRGTQATGAAQILRRYAVANALFAFTRPLPPAFSNRWLVMLRFAFCRLLRCAIVRSTLWGGPRSGPETCQTGTL